ncbi:MAG: cation:proton antiporter [Gammaproteobacteria bacterium]|nr:cation:proton antiporter [Gammaproteobacteria bacterium]
MAGEPVLWSTVLGLTGLLMLAVLMLPAARRLEFPYTVLLAAVGVLIGLLDALTVSAELPVIGDFFAALRGIEITAEAVFFIFLPALVFEAAMVLDVRRLLDDLGAILFMAVVGLLISTVIIGVSIWSISGFTLIACLMLGVIVSATDPVAVVAIFKEVGAPKRLSILVEGESLFNDATAILLFTILAGMLAGGAEPGLLEGVTGFLTVFLGGALVGWVLGRLFVWIISKLENMPMVERTLTICLAYLSFIVAEHYLHTSGVMAVVVAALVMGSRGRTVIAPHDWHGLHDLWEQIGFWANSIIFILVGLAVPAIMMGFGSQQALWLLVLILSAFAARALILFGLLPLLSRWHLVQQVSVGFRTVMFWGGLRGAVALALALVVIESPQYSEEIRQFVGILVTGFVLFTLFVNAPTIGFVIKLFRLDQLSASDVAVRDRALALALGRIGDNIERVAARQEASPETTAAIAGAYRSRSDAAQTALESLRELSLRDWEHIGLANLAARERAAYDHQFEDGFMPSATYRILGEQLDDLTDALRMGGPKAYGRTAARSLEFGRDFHIAMALQRRFGMTAPLARAVADRFARLSGARLALAEVAADGLSKVRELVGAEAGEALERRLHARREATEAALESLERQYPDYARRIERRLLQQGALRLEEQSYRRMYADGLISGEVLGDLIERLRDQEREQERLPKLDLGLDPRRLVAQVPLFQGLPEARIDELAALLKPRLVLPGERVVTRGEQGDAMYFISNGALRVDLDSGPVVLGSGDFFGELALITHQPRNADVIASGFADLLLLRTVDFQRFMAANPDTREKIEAVARERLGADGRM